jgi:nicotinate-nucleotide pyrophosphorylase (carboxylating)
LSRPPADPEANREPDLLTLAATDAALRSLSEDLAPPQSVFPYGSEARLAGREEIDDLTWAALRVTLASVIGSGQQNEGGLSISATARFIAREAGVLAGTLAAGRCFELLDESTRIDWLESDGAEFQAGVPLGRVEGSLGVLLAAERSALNLLCHLSGIATATRSFVEEARKFNENVIVRDTRKTLAGLRFLEKEAVRAGGGENHRFGLYDGILLKDNHLEAARALGIPESKVLAEFVRHAGRNRRSGEIEIEADDEATAKLAAASGATVVLCDNMSPETVARVVQAIGDRAKVEASGRITLDNIGRYAEAGVDYIAVGSITHSARAIDISFEISEAWRN